MPARLRIATLLAPLALLAACDAQPRAEAAVAHPATFASNAADAKPAVQALRSTDAARPASASTEKLPPADCDPAKEAAAKTASTSADPMARVRDVMAGRSRGGLAGAEPIRCDPNEKKKAAPGPGGAGT